jgi:hypothetical protein
MSETFQDCFRQNNKKTFLSIRPEQENQKRRIFHPAFLPAGLLKNLTFAEKNCYLTLVS